MNINYKNQKGATLIVALVVLTIVTLLGVAGIRGTALDMKMIAGARDKALAFEAAETTLSIVENELKVNPPTLANITAGFSKDCSSADAANKGKCFTGQIAEPADPYRTCSTYDSAADKTQLWERKDTWSTNHRIEDVKLADDSTISTKYIVEFMCFTLKDRKLLGKVDDRETGDENIIYMPLFRITAIAEGVGKRARVAAQTTVRVNLKGA
ncbi:MAG: PilX N-terminal domain-containing pilus assembly protein [Marinagarivorans sp.]|nr:PilX N-terminal domain-containing pilus assembly protein [Marinagarivorans sp.]